MYATVINVDRFDPAFRSGLLFSLFEGLKVGEKLKIISDENLEGISQQFKMAAVNNLKLFQRFDEYMGLSFVEVIKTSDNNAAEPFISFE